MNLTDKVAIVTGGSRGIGRAISIALADAGAKVIVASRTEMEVSDNIAHAQYASGTIHQTVNIIRENGGIALAVKCDVSEACDISTLVASTMESFGRIDILVSNAGIDCEAPVVDLDIETLDQCIAVNVRAPLLLCKMALPHMLSQNSGGSIFAITSGSARAYRLGRVGYSMSKAALERTFLSLAEELKSDNIAVNLLGPGRVDTWMNRRGDWPGTGHIPMVHPDEIKPAAVWLAAQNGNSFTGNVVESSEFGMNWGVSRYV